MKGYIFERHATHNDVHIRTALWANEGLSHSVFLLILDSRLMQNGVQERGGGMLILTINDLQRAKKTDFAFRWCAKQVYAQITHGQTEIECIYTYNQEGLLRSGSSGVKLKCK